MRGCLMGVECKTTLRRPRIVCVLPVPGGPCIQNPCGLHFSHHHQHSILKATKYVWHGKLDGTQRKKIVQEPIVSWQSLKAAISKSSSQKIQTSWDSKNANICTDVNFNTLSTSPYMPQAGDFGITQQSWNLSDNIYFMRSLASDEIEYWLLKIREISFIRIEKSPPSQWRRKARLTLPQEATERT
jgi:hypothetical protein